MVPTGYTVKLYQHGGFNGVTLDVPGDCECTRLDNKDNAANYNFNKQTSGIKMW